MPTSIQDRATWDKQQAFHSEDISMLLHVAKKAPTLLELVFSPYLNSSTNSDISFLHRQTNRDISKAVGIILDIGFQYGDYKPYPFGYSETQVKTKLVEELKVINDGLLKVDRDFRSKGVVCTPKYIAEYALWQLKQNMFTHLRHNVVSSDSDWVYEIQHLREQNSTREQREALRNNGFLRGFASALAPYNRYATNILLHLREGEQQGTKTDISSLPSVQELPSDQVKKSLSFNVQILKGLGKKYGLNMESLTSVIYDLMIEHLGKDKSKGVEPGSASQQAEDAAAAAPVRNVSQRRGRQQEQLPIDDAAAADNSFQSRVLQSQVVRLQEQLPIDDAAAADNSFQSRVHQPQVDRPQELRITNHKIKGLVNDIMTLTKDNPAKGIAALCVAVQNTASTKAFPGTSDCSLRTLTKKLKHVIRDLPTREQQRATQELYAIIMPERGQSRHS